MQGPILSLMMIVFAPIASESPSVIPCHMPSDQVESVIIKVGKYSTQVFINYDEYVCLCGRPGESVHIFKDQVLVCCELHRPTLQEKEAAM